MFSSFFTFGQYRRDRARAAGILWRLMRCGSGWTELSPKTRELRRRAVTLTKLMPGPRVRRREGRAIRWRVSKTIRSLFR